MREKAIVKPAREWFKMPKKDALEVLKHHKDDVNLEKLWESGQPKKEENK